MTRDEILNMEAGPELNALVADLVLETPFRKPTHGTCCTCQVCGYGYDDCLCGLSEDLDMAWLVVEKTRPLWRITLDIERKTTTCDFDDYARTYTARSRSTPLAICQAALLATMEDTNEPH